MKSFDASKYLLLTTCKPRKIGYYRLITFDYIWPASVRQPGAGKLAPRPAAKQ